MRRIGLHVGLALLLVLAQQAAFAHLISHAARPDTQQQSAADTSTDTAHETAKACAKCLVAAQLGNAVGSTPPALPQLFSALPAPSITVVASRSIVLHAYRSRAPPTVL